jgi:hypothetical protein
MNSLNFMLSSAARNAVFSKCCGTGNTVFLRDVAWSAKPQPVFNVIAPRADLIPVLRAGAA